MPLETTRNAAQGSAARQATQRPIRREHTSKLTTKFATFRFLSRARSEPHYSSIHTDAPRTPNKPDPSISWRKRPALVIRSTIPSTPSFVGFHSSILFAIPHLREHGLGEKGNRCATDSLCLAKPPAIQPSTNRLRIREPPIQPKRPQPVLPVISLKGR